MGPGADHRQEQLMGGVCDKYTVSLKRVLNEAGDPITRTFLGQGEGAVGERVGATSDVGVGGPSCVVAPMLSNPFQ